MIICDICKRKKELKTTWCLSFYFLPSFKVCKECDLCFQQQIYEILDYQLKYLEETKGVRKWK